MNTRLIQSAELQAAFDLVMSDLTDKRDALLAVAHHGTAEVEELVCEACLVVSASIDADAIRARLTAGVPYPKDTEHDPVTEAAAAPGPWPTVVSASLSSGDDGSRDPATEQTSGPAPGPRAAGA